MDQDVQQHVRDQVWGMFDLPGAAVPLCFQCLLQCGEQQIQQGPQFLLLWAAGGRSLEVRHFRFLI